LPSKHKALSLNPRTTKKKKKKKENFGKILQELGGLFGTLVTVSSALFLFRPMLKYNHHIHINLSPSSKSHVLSGISQTQT
jgi:hypothetical protein